MHYKHMFRFEISMGSIPVESCGTSGSSELLLCDEKNGATVNSIVLKEQAQHTSLPLFLSPDSFDSIGKKATTWSSSLLKVLAPVI